MNRRLPPVGVLLLLLGTASFLSAPSVSALTIHTNFIGGDASASTAGGGNIVSIFNAAASVWELAIQDPFTVTFNYGWASSLGAGATHSLVTQGGSPNRESVGTVLFSNDNSTVPWFLDPTPLVNEEFQSFVQTTQDLGGGQMIVARYWTDPTGAAIDTADLFMIALHEIGHGLGMSLANASFVSEAADGAINITAPAPFAGAAAPLATNIFGVTSHFDAFALAYGNLMAGGNAGERRLPSELDILGNAQISGFHMLNLALDPRPEFQVPHAGTLGLVFSGLAGLFCLGHLRGK